MTAQIFTSIVVNSIFLAFVAAFYEEARRTYVLDISAASGSVEYIKLAAYAVTGEIYNAWLSEGSIP